MEYNDVLLRPIKKTLPMNESKDEFHCRKRREREEEDDLDDSLFAIEDDMLATLMLRRRKRRNPVSDRKRRNRRGRYLKYTQYFTDPETGVRSLMRPEHTVWYQCYILHPNPQSKKWQKLFRYRFRMPYESYLDLVLECEKSPIMAQWSRLPEYRYNKKKGASIELLVLCVLRWLGRGWTLDDLYENTMINPETIRLFIQQFINWGSTTLYDKYVRCPMTADELSDCEKEFHIAELPGCVGSTDATHIVTPSLQASLHCKNIQPKSESQEKNIKYYEWSSIQVQ